MEKFGYETIVQTIKDAINAELEVNKSLDDGKYEVIEVFRDALSTYPKVEAAVKNFKSFIAEVEDLSIDESAKVKEAVMSVFTEDQLDASYVAGFVIFGKDAYLYLQSTIRGADGLKESFKYNVLKKRTSL